MRIKCKINQISKIPEIDTQERLRRTIHLEDPISDLEVGKEYEVQAIERWDNEGIKLYLDVYGSPRPFPVEFFDFVDETIPREWCIYPEGKYEDGKWKRISFPEWAKDDRFLEKLIHLEDPDAVELYELKKRNSD